MSSRRRAAALLILGAAAFAGPAAAGSKLGTPAARLLLPLFVVEAADPAGPTTFFAVRNESAAETVDVDIRYFEADKADTPQLTETVTLAPKATHTASVRSRLADLEIDGDGFARGYVVFEAVGGAATLHGDYFQVDDSQNFATGFRLLVVDPGSRSNDLCTRLSMRFLNSALIFDSGTVFTVWFEPADPYEGIAFTYTVYDLAGRVVGGLQGLPSDKFAFEQPASGLLFMVAEEFGAIEFEFPPGTQGHVSAVMSAFERFSVGFEATCLDSN